MSEKELGHLFDLPLDFFTSPEQEVMKFKGSLPDDLLGIGDAARRMKELRYNRVVLDLRKIEDATRERKIPFLLALRCFQISFVSFVRYGQAVSTLIDLAKEGDPDDLVKLVKLDLSLLSAPYARNILQGLELSANHSVALNIGTYLQAIESTDLHRLRNRIQSLIA